MPVHENADATETTEESVDIPHELADETHLLNLCGIAEEQYAAEELSAARQAHREWMRNHGQGDPVAAGALRLRDMNGATVKARALLCYAAAKVRDEGRDGRENVPTQDSLGGDPGEGKKGKRAKRKAKGPKKSKRSTAWLRHIGATVAAFRAGFGPDDDRLLEMLRQGAFARRDEEVGATPEYGFCLLDDPTRPIADLAALPTLGADPEYLVIGLRKDEKKGCPTHRFRYEAERQATEEARAEGKENAASARIKEITSAKVTAWYRAATPQTAVVPVVYHRPSFTFLVCSRTDVSVDQAVSLIQRTIGSLTRTPGALDAVDWAGLSRTDVRSEETETAGGPDLSADLLLWLVGRQLGGTGVLQLDEADAAAIGVTSPRLEWWLDDVAELSRDTADEKKLRIRLAGAPAEGGSLAGALADGASFRSVNLSLRIDEQTWTVTLSGGRAYGWELPALTKPDGTPAGLDSAIDERLRLWRRGQDLLDRLVAAFVAERRDRSSWRQRVTAIRAALGIEIVRRWAFDPVSKNGLLFAHMLPGEQGTLGGVKVDDEREETPRTSRGRAGRNRAAEA